MERQDLMHEHTDNLASSKIESGLGTAALVVKHSFEKFNYTRIVTYGYEKMQDIFNKIKHVTLEGRGPRCDSL